MRKTMRIIAAAALMISGLAAISPAYAHKQKQPSMQSDMMKGGGMEGMMGMMEKMNKMMDLCSKMMEGKMDGKDGSDMKMPMEPPAATEKKS
ncbi:MAG: hypothetical protein ACOZAM_09300 [Pseudomonadota bacterium]